MVLSYIKKKHQRTLSQLYQHPISANIKWKDIEGLFVELGGEIQEREGSRVAVILFEQVKVFHRPHPDPNTDKGAVASIRKWLSENGVYPYA
ncbi:MAG: type II toxin-antitoxin system HicA family toxin [Pasteurellaceae bacterium]|nr:type II toxin-antitoxin system HicA family toxin [Pasteurellaceae bacterium]